QRRNPAHARVGEGEEILPDPLDAEWVLTDDERGDALEDLADGAHAFRTPLREERPVSLADAHEAGVGREPHDELAHPADRGGGSANRLRQRCGQEVRSERCDLLLSHPRRLYRITCTQRIHLESSINLFNIYIR